MPILCHLVINYSEYDCILMVRKRKVKCGESINFCAVFKTQWHKSGTNEDFLKFRIAQYVGITGAPGTIRTCDPQYRKLMLYPAELRVHLVGVVCVEDSRTNGLNYSAS